MGDTTVTEIAFDFVDSVHTDAKVIELIDLKALSDSTYEINYTTFNVLFLTIRIYPLNYYITFL